MDGVGMAIDRRTVQQAVADRLREMVVEGVLAPGARLSERELGERLGVSRTPVREAFRALVAEGLLEWRASRAPRVVRLGEAEIGHAFETVGGLEAMAGELACRRIDASRLAVIRALQAEMETCHAAGDLPGYYRVNRAVHERIAEAAANPVLAETRRRANAGLHALRFRSNFDRAKWDRAVSEHRAMVKALEARDGPRMRAILLAHLAQKCESVLEEMRAARADGPTGPA